MITTIADLLQALMAKERDKLDQEAITHPPSIGAMYEGLTRDILERAIPPTLDLRLVDGFIEGFDGAVGPQVDVMLVTGEGRPIPYTASFVWPIARVIAVFEVKKNLFGTDLEDAFVKLRTVREMHDLHVQSGQAAKFTILPAFRAFARLTGLYPRGWSAADALPDPQSFIFHALVSEQSAPVRIVLGFHGYADEAGLRRGLVKFMDEHLMGGGFGVTSFPNLIICRDNALLKMNGQPYSCPMDGDWWPLIVSNNENPLRLMIELIWTRLSNQFETAFTMDDTLKLERLAPFLSARLETHGDQVGWNYRYDELKSAQLASAAGQYWAPEEHSTAEGVLLMQVARHGEVEVMDPDFRKFMAEEGADPDAVVADLVERRVLAWSDAHTVRAIEEGTMLITFLPDGRTVSSTQTDLFRLWLMEQRQHHPLDGVDAPA